MYSSLIAVASSSSQRQERTESACCLFARAMLNSKQRRKGQHAYSLFALTLCLEVTNDAAVFVYHTQMLSDIPLTVHSKGHITIQRCSVTVEKVAGYQDEAEREEESEISSDYLRNNSNCELMSRQWIV